VQDWNFLFDNENSSRTMIFILVGLFSTIVAQTCTVQHTDGRSSTGTCGANCTTALSTSGIAACAGAKCCTDDAPCSLGGVCKDESVCSLTAGKLAVSSDCVGYGAAVKCCIDRPARPNVTFTGNVETDFWSQPRVVTTFDFVSGSGTPSPDVGLPVQVPAGTISGWDVKSIDFIHDFERNALHIGVNCFGVCGDADGDGDPDKTAPFLVDLGGIDTADFASTEAVAILLDFGNATAGPDGVFDFIIGYPGGGTLSCAVGGRAPFAASDCFGLYNVSQFPGTNLGLAFVEPTAAKHATADHNPRPSLSRPDLEWTIEDLTALLAKANIRQVDSRGLCSWELAFRAYSGSFMDAGIGEDSVPNTAISVRVKFGDSRTANASASFCTGFATPSPSATLPPTPVPTPATPAPTPAPTPAATFESTTTTTATTSTVSATQTLTESGTAASKTTILSVEVETTDTSAELPANISLVLVVLFVRTLLN
jgi:hypothetical protein